MIIVCSFVGGDIDKPRRSPFTLGYSKRNNTKCKKEKIDGVRVKAPIKTGCETSAVACDGGFNLVLNSKSVDSTVKVKCTSAFNDNT